MENGYSICLNKWALDKNIKNELGLLLIISSLCAEKGYCFASNQYLAEMFDTLEVTISRKIKILVDKGYLDVEYEKHGCEIKGRKIRLAKMLIHDYQKCKSTISKNAKDNNTSSINITSINNNREGTSQKRFIKPTIEEIQEYCIKRKNNINAESFYDFYESKNWYVGKNKMVDWKASVRTWENRDKTKKYKTSYEKRQEMYRRIEEEYDNQGN